MKKLHISSYVGQLFFYLSSIMTLILIIFSVSLYNGYSANGVRTLQLYNQKLNAQILKNYENIDSIITSVFANKINSETVANLMYAKTINKFDEIRFLTALKKEFSAYPMYHSAIVYNNQTKEKYLLNISEAEAVNIVANIYRGDKIPRLTSIPIESVKITGQKELLFSYYMYDYLTPDSICDGAFILNIDTKWIIELMQTQYDQNMNVIITDKYGRIILDSKNKYNFGEKLDRPYINELVSNEVIQIKNFSFNEKSEKTVVSTSKINKTDWYVICEQTLSDYDAMIKPIRRFTILIMLIMTIISFVVALVLSQHIYNPLKKLVAYVKDIKGDEKQSTNDYKYLEIAFKDINYRKNELSRNQKIIYDIKKQNYFKNLLSDGCICDDSNDAAECINFVKSGNIFAILLKTHIKSVDWLGQIWDTWATGKYNSYEKVYLDDYSLVLLIKDTGMNILREKFFSDFDDFKKTIHNKLSTTVSAFFTKYHTLETVALIMPELNELQRYEIMYSVGCCLNRDIIDKYHTNGSFNYPVNEANKLLNTLKNKDLEQSKLCFDEFLMNIITSDIDGFILSLTKLVLSIQNLYEESNFNKKSNLYCEITNLTKKIMNLNNIEELNTDILTLFKLFCEVRKPADSKNGIIANSIADYINISYQDPNLGTNGIAAMFNLSSGHISKIFKEEKNISISNYINTVRLNASLELIKNTNKSINEIIDKVGFINESGYYKLFKKTYGITPKEFRVNKALSDAITKVPPN